MRVNLLAVAVTMLIAGNAVQAQTTSGVRTSPPPAPNAGVAGPGAKPAVPASPGPATQLPAAPKSPTPGAPGGNKGIIDPLFKKGAEAPQKAAAPASPAMFLK